MPRILLVDDERLLKTSLAAALRRDGYQVVVADDAEEALETTADEAVDLLVTDVRMAGMSGLELLRTLRERQPALPAIVMTADGSVETAVEAMRLGAADLLTKPFPVGELREVVARVLGAQHAPRCPFPLADVPHEFLAARGATDHVHDLWRVGPGRRGILFARVPAAGGSVLTALVRAEAAHHPTPRAVVASVEAWLGGELDGFVGVVDAVARLLRFAARGAVVARLQGSSFGEDDLTGAHEDAGMAVEGSDRLVVSSTDAAGAHGMAVAEAPRLAAGAALRVHVGSLAASLEEETLTLRTPCSPDDYIRCTEALAARAGLDENQTFHVAAAVVEAVENAQNHAYSGRHGGIVELRYILTPPGLVIHVVDHGCGCDPAVAERGWVDPGDLLRESGRGFLLMHHLMDAVEVDAAPGRGTIVRMEKGRDRGDSTR